MVKTYKGKYSHNLTVTVIIKAILFYSSIAVTLSYIPCIHTRVNSVYPFLSDSDIFWNDLGNFPGFFDVCFWTLHFRPADGDERDSSLPLRSHDTQLVLSC